jgi:hypothetical protein
MDRTAGSFVQLACLKSNSRRKGLVHGRVVRAFPSFGWLLKFALLAATTTTTGPLVHEQRSQPSQSRLSATATPRRRPPRIDDRAAAGRRAGRRRPNWPRSRPGRWWPTASTATTPGLSRRWVAPGCRSCWHSSPARASGRRRTSRTPRWRPPASWAGTARVGPDRGGGSSAASATATPRPGEPPTRCWAAGGLTAATGWWWPPPTQPRCRSFPPGTCVVMTCATSRPNGSIPVEASQRPNSRAWCTSQAAR